MKRLLGSFSIRCWMKSLAGMGHGEAISACAYHHPPQLPQHCRNPSPQHPGEGGGVPAYPSLRCRPSRASQTRTRPAGSAQRAWHRSRRRMGGNHKAWGGRWGGGCWPRVVPGGRTPVEGRGREGGYVQNVGDDPDGPAIHCLAVGLLRQHLWGWGDGRGKGGPQPPGRDPNPTPRVVTAHGRRSPT